MEDFCWRRNSYLVFGHFFSNLCQSNWDINMRPAHSEALFPKFSYGESSYLISWSILEWFKFENYKIIENLSWTFLLPSAKKIFCSQSGQNLVFFLDLPEIGHSGGKNFVLLKITFPFISGDLRAKKIFDPPKIFLSPRC